MSFGELALISSKPRAATIKCLEPTDFAVMHKKDYLKVLVTIEEKSREEIIKFLQSTPYFSAISRQILLKLMMCFSEKKVVKN